MIQREIAPGVLNEFEISLITCFSGMTRRSDEIIAEQQRRMTASGVHFTQTGAESWVV